MINNIALSVINLIGSELKVYSVSMHK